MRLFKRADNDPRIWMLPVLKGMLLLAMLALTFSYAMFQGGFVSWFFFYSFLPFALYSLLIFLYPFKDFQVEREIEPPEGKAGDTLQVTIRLNRRIPFPLLYLVVEDIGPEVLAASGRKTMLFPGFRRKMAIYYSIPRVPRGEHHFAGVWLKTGDAIGLIEKQCDAECHNKILVYPSFADMVYRPLESRFEQGTTASNLKIQRDTTMAVGLRPYQPGDRFSWIDWKATARKNEMVTKEFEVRQSNDLLIVLDRSPAVDFELIVTFAASVTRAVLRNGGNAGLMSIGGERTWLPVRGGEQQEADIFYHLAKVKPDCKVPFSAVLEEEAAGMRQPASMLILTVRLTDELINGTGIYAKRKHAVFIFLVKKAGESLTEEELAARAAASAQGIWVKIVEENHFRTALMEVKRA